MTDINTLEALARAALDPDGEVHEQDWLTAARPDVVLALIADLRAARDHASVLTRSLATTNEALSQTRAALGEALDEWSTCVRLAEHEGANVSLERARIAELRRWAP